MQSRLCAELAVGLLDPQHHLPLGKRAHLWDRQASQRPLDDCPQGAEQALLEERVTFTLLQVLSWLGSCHWPLGWLIIVGGWRRLCGR